MAEQKEKPMQVHIKKRQAEKINFIIANEQREVSYKITPAMVVEQALDVHFEKLFSLEVDKSEEKKVIFEGE